MKKIIIIAIILLIAVSIFLFLLLNKQKLNKYEIPFNQIEFTDEEIVNFVKSKNDLPSYFIVDKDKDFLGDYGSVLYADVKIDNKNIFYCTDNINDTKQYVNEFIEDKSGGGLKGAEYNLSIIETAENNRFFEFRINRKSKQGSRKFNYQYRVLKCSYANGLLHGVYGNPFLNQLNISMHIGALNQRPITAESVKEFAESMWSNGGFAFGDKVLNSFTEKKNGFFQHTIHETMTGCLEMTDCCSTTLYKSEYVIDENSGKISFSRKKIKTVKHGSDGCY